MAKQDSNKPAPQPATKPTSFPVPPRAPDPGVGIRSA